MFRNTNVFSGPVLRNQCLFFSFLFFLNVVGMYKVRVIATNFSYILLDICRKFRQTYDIFHGNSIKMKIGVQLL